MNARNETLRRMSLHASMEHDVLAESDENPVRRHALWDFCDRAEKGLVATFTDGEISPVLGGPFRLR
ncbi:hypothetical protein LAL4801_05726 [Roseibium aggregatum]|uniref:Uncharacterized protein n=1 Tax=Roseibium aggregatum TaxID=187304 RepID=A0A0M6YC28_9HYPH|nr:hypothetical protein LAL4801_05726 [Roseibium aggregatum]